MAYPSRMLTYSLMAVLLAACGGGSGSSGNAAVAAQSPAPSPTATPTASQTPVSTPSGTWQLAWSDEFDGAAINSAHWNVIEDCWGGGNEERQCYTARPENVAVRDGKLVITAYQEEWSGDAWPQHLKASMPDPEAQKTQEFTSGRLNTQGKLSWRYGRIEMRARLPQGQGVWPAFWMMPEDNVYGTWAASGEIDIMEVINLGAQCPTCTPGGENSTYGALHFGGQWPDNDYTVSGHNYPAILDGGFHVFGVIWEEGQFTWTIDGEPFATKTAADWFTTGSDNPNAPFNENFHLIVNLAIGGRWPEGEGAGGVARVNFPKSMEIDWIRVYQCDADQATGRGCS